MSKKQPAAPQSSLEAFEAEAELFYKDTGFLAPGKSEPAASFGRNDFEREEVRRLMKKAWDAGRRRQGPAFDAMARLAAHDAGTEKK